MNNFNPYLHRRRWEVTITFILAIVILITTLTQYAAPKGADGIAIQNPIVKIPTLVLTAANDYNVSVIAKAAKLYYYSNNETLPASISDMVTQGYLEFIPRQPFNPGQYYSIEAAEKTFTIYPGRCKDDIPQANGTTYEL